ncbi:MAG: helix-turn-helix domain-containing protein, partial [Tepidiformaceae bacterium]
MDSPQHARRERGLGESGVPHMAELDVEPLTGRQREVLNLIARGYTNPQIADALGVSIDGAKWHVREILSKLGVD